MIPLKIFCSDYNFPRKKTKISFHPPEGKLPLQIRLPKPRSAELTRPDLGRVWAGHVRELPPVTATNRGWEASAFQHGKRSAESWDFSGEKKNKKQNSCASKATQPTRSLQG